MTDRGQHSQDIVFEKNVRPLVAVPKSSMETCFSLSVRVIKGVEFGARLSFILINCVP